jgi:hypothetical protein
VQRWTYAGPAFIDRRGSTASIARTRMTEVNLQARGGTLIGWLVAKRESHELVDG